MSLPKFDFKSADRHTAQRFIVVCIQSRKFYRTVDGKVLFGPPHDWIPVTRAAELGWILLDGQAIEYSGPDDETTIKFLWHSLNDQRWKLPRAGGQPVVRS